MPLTKTPLLAETVRKLVRRGATPNAYNILSKLHPSDIAELLGELHENFRKPTFELLVQRDLSLASEALSELGVDRGVELLLDMSSEEISKLLQELDPDDAAEFVGHLPTELQEEILGAMRQKNAADVQDLLQHPEQTAGRIMNPNVFSLHEDITVGEAITRLQTMGEVEMAFYIYIVDDRNHLVGVLSLRQLLLKRPERRLKDIMVSTVISVRTDTDQEDVARLVDSYNILAMPVVDEENKLVGMIPVDDVIDVIKEEATEDIYRLAGLDVHERVFSSPRTSVRMRIPWLAVNLATAFLATPAPKRAFVVELVEQPQGAAQGNAGRAHQRDCDRCPGRLGRPRMERQSRARFGHRPGHGGESSGGGRSGNARALSLTSHQGGSRPGILGLRHHRHGCFRVPILPRAWGVLSGTLRLS